MHQTVRFHSILTAMQVGRHIIDLQVRQEVLFVREIADGPYQARRHRFRMRFFTQLELPLDPVRVGDDELGIGAVEILFDEFEGTVRLVLLCLPDRKSCRGSRYLPGPPTARRGAFDASFATFFGAAKAVTLSARTRKGVIVMGDSSSFTSPSFAAIRMPNCKGMIYGEEPDLGRPIVKCLVQPGDGAMPLIKAIKDAKKSVEIVIFRFNRSEIEKALAAAVTRGVHVHALIASTNRGGVQNLRDLEMRLLAAGVTVSRTDDDLVRYHGKLMIVDRRVLFLLAFNFTYLDMERSRSFGIITTTRSTWSRRQSCSTRIPNVSRTRRAAPPLSSAP